MSSSENGSTSSTSSRTTKASTLSVGKMSLSSSGQTRDRAASRASVSSSIRGGCPECRDKKRDDLGLKINTEALVELASSLRGGRRSSLGHKISGGTNYLVELVFDDGVTWFARIPKPWRSSHANAVMYSEVSAYRYLKRHTRIPVPEVYHYANDTDSDNAVGVSFMLIEKLPGSSVPEITGDSEADREKARRFHEQLSDIIYELGACKFDRIGSIQQSRTNSEEFTIGPLFNLYNTYPLQRGKTEQNRGPYTSVSEYYHAFSELNYRDTKAHYRPTSDICAPIDEELARFYVINKMVPRFAEETGVNEGPFTFMNWGLTSQNILVDNDGNITGLIDISGVVGPLPSLCRYPDLIYETRHDGLFFDRKHFLSIFLNRDVPSHLLSGSALESKELRAKYMATAHKVWQFENTILYPAHKHLNLRGRGGLYDYVFDDAKYDEKVEFRKLGNTDVEFQKLVPRLELPQGKYSWELPPQKQKQKKRRASNAQKGGVKKVWEKTPWVKTHKEDKYVREYVRVHHHLPPQVAAYNGKRRSNGPEKAFYMAWAFIRCRDASYMKKKNEKRRGKQAKVRRSRMGSMRERSRIGSIRDRTGRVRGWSVGLDSRPLSKGKGTPRTATEPTAPPKKGWKKVFGGLL